MKVKNTLKNNVGITAKGKRVLFPAEGILELDDKVYADHIESIKLHVEKGNFVFLKKPALSKEEQAKLEAKELAEAEALVAAAKQKALDTGK